MLLTKNAILVISGRGLVCYNVPILRSLCFNLGSIPQALQILLHRPTGVVDLIDLPALVVRIEALRLDKPGLTGSRPANA